MPDARTHPAPGFPQDWGDAFAALPLQAPPDDAWTRVAAALPARRARWPRALATAAVLALALGASLQFANRGQQDAPRATRNAFANTGASQPAPRIASTGTPTPPVSTAIARDVPTPAPARATPAMQVAASTNPRTSRAHAERTGTPGRAEPASGSNAAATLPAATDAPRFAAADTNAGNADATLPSPTGPGDAQPAGELDGLYAQSAQLEALLAMARDDRVASGAAAALAGDLDAQVARIDAALVQPGIDAGERTRLWRDRVGALQQLASFESTQRLLAAEGERYDASLVTLD